jgi:carbonic anhydrase/acetyltransferase-like protein (isoleucine patch superfamily)
VPIYALGGLQPDIDSSAFVHPDAVIIGAVTLGPQASVWPGAVLRGDNGEIRIGARSSVQDNSVLHCTPAEHTIVGDDCVIGHLVHLEGCTLEHHVLVGNMAQVLHRVVVRSGAVIAANSVVLYGTEVPAGALAVGSPATIKEGRARMSDITAGVDAYVANGRRYQQDLRRLD